jgi:hypothetical protein
MKPRSLNRHRNCRPTRHTTRMLNGVRRPPPPNYLALACRALEEVIRIDKRLLPYMAEQKQLLEQWLFRQEVEAALQKVYGQATCQNPPEQSVTHWCATSSASVNRKRARQILKEEVALAKTHALVALLESKTGKQTVNKR